MKKRVWLIERQLYINLFNLWVISTICWESGNALYTVKENPDKMLYRSSRHDKNDVINA